MLQVTSISIDKIKSDLAPLNKSLQLSMLEVNQKDPIKVRPIVHSQFEYECVNGRRRLRTLRENGVTSVLAIIEEMSEEEAAIQALVLNSGTPNELDEARHILWLENKGYTGQQIATMTGYSQATISQRKKLVEKLHPLGQEKLQSGEIKVSTALCATKLPFEEQKKLFSKSKVSYREIFEALRDFQSSQIVFDLEIEKETKPGIFLTGEQVESLFAGLFVKVDWSGVSFNIKAERI